jgi:hypothetical protein
MPIARHRSTNKYRLCSDEIGSEFRLGAIGTRRFNRSDASANVRNTLLSSLSGEADAIPMPSAGRGATDKAVRLRFRKDRLYFGARLANIRCSVRRCILSRRAVSETLRSHIS